MHAKMNRRQTDTRGADTHPEPSNVRDRDRPAVEQPTEARAGQILRGGIMRRVLVASLILVVVALGLIYLIFV